MLKNRSQPNIQELRQRRIREGNIHRKQQRQDWLTRQRSFDIHESADLVEKLIEDVDMLDVDGNDGALKDEWLKLLFSEVIYDQLGAAQKLSRLVSRKPELARAVIDMGLMPRLFDLLQESQLPKLQHKAALVLNDLTVEKVAQSLPENAVHVLAEVLESEAEDEVKVPVIAILGNIAQESEKLRDEVLASRAWPALLNILKSTAKNRMLSSSVFALHNICARIDEPPDLSLVSLCLPRLVSLMHHDDNDILLQTCWSLSSICELSIQTVVDAGACPRLVELLDCSFSAEVLAAVVHVLVIITSGNEKQTQTIIDFQALPKIFQLLQTSHNNVMVEQTCRMLSNVAGGTCEQIQSIIDGGFVQVFMELLSHEKVEIQVEAACSIRQCLSRSRSSPAQIDQLVNIGVVPALCRMLKSENIEILHVVLRSLKVFLDFDSAKYLWAFEGDGGA